LNLEPELDLKERRTHTEGMYKELGPEAVPVMVYSLGLQRWRARPAMIAQGDNTVVVDASCCCGAVGDRTRSQWLDQHSELWLSCCL
jgi:hypothetical protein